MMCGSFRIGCDAEEACVEPYPALLDPTPIPDLAVPFRRHVYRLSIRTVCGLFLVGSDSGRIGVGP